MQPTTAAPWAVLVRRAGIAYLLSRLAVLAGAAIVAAQRVADDRNLRITRPRNAVGHIVDVLTSWDGKWYFALIRSSYPSSVPHGVSWDEYQARTAFFPVFPTLVRWIDPLLPGGDVFAALALNTVLGAVAIYLVGALARELFDAETAYRAMMLMALFPGAFVLSFAYSEAALLAAAAGCLLALRREQWWLAGVLASIGAATRPNGVALIAACAVAAIVVIVRHRAWRALIAPALAPIGFIAFHLFLWRRTGERLAWFRTQRDAWNEGASFGLTALRNTVEAFAHPLSSPTDVITALSFLATIVLVVAAVKRRLPIEIVAYCAVVLALMLLPDTVTARPRFVYTAFPLLISAAAWSRSLEAAHDDEPHWWGHQLWLMTIGGCAAGLVTITALYGVSGAIP